MTAGLIISGVGMIGGAIGNRAAKSAMEEQEGHWNSQSAKYEGMLNEAKENRPDITNPYANMTNAFANLSNPYANMTNEYANLSVSTGAAEFQAEQADIALANTLDTMMATGMGSGGATALAQAALQSKKGIAADIQQQESANQKLKAKGAMDVAQMKAEGQLRTDQAKAQGEQNVQQLKGQGAQFEMQTLENRSIADMGYAAGMMQNAQQNAVNAGMAATQADVDLANSFASTLGGIGGSMFSAGLK